MITALFYFPHLTLMALEEMFARLMLWSDRGTMFGPGCDCESVSFNQVPLASLTVP